MTPGKTSRSVRRTVGAAIVGLIGCTGIPPAGAQSLYGPFLESPIPLDIDLGRQQSVLERPRPEYQPDGVLLGGFTVFPEVQFGLGATDNVFAASQDTRSAAFVTLDPRVRATSNWLRHGLSLSAAGAFRRFIDREIRNEDGFAARADGRLDVSSDLVLNGGAEFRQDYQSQYSSEVPGNAVAPIRYQREAALLRATYGAGRVRAIVAGDVNRLDFRDARLGTATIDQDFRDRTVLRGAGRLEFAAFNDTFVFGEVSVAGIEHRREFITPTTPNRDGSDYRALAGISFDFAGAARARIGAGYIRRTFDAPIYPRLAGFGYDARVEFFPSGLTTITAGARRSIGESTITGSSGYFSSEWLLRADHELKRNILLHAQAQYERNRFKGIERRDAIWVTELGGNYLINQSFSVGGGATYSKRSSRGSAGGQEFNELRGIVSVTYAL